MLGPACRPVVTTITWRRMLHRFSGGGDDDCLEEDAQPGLPGCGDDDCLGGGCSAGLPAVVTTITWRTMLLELARGGEDDCVEGRCSRSSLSAPGGEDAPWRRMLPWPGTATGGDDDCVGGRVTLVTQPIAREEPLGSDYRQWRSGFSRDDWGWVWEGNAPPSEREEEQALLAGPSGPRQENAATMNEKRWLQATDQREVPSSSREERQGSRCRLTALAVRRASGNRSLTNAGGRLAPRTHSGGRPFRV